MKSVSRKKKVWIAVGIVLSAVLITGIVFAVLRPHYTKEAVDILFKNELNMAPMDDQGPQEFFKGVHRKNPPYVPEPEVEHPTAGKTAPRTQDPTQAPAESSETSDED